MSEYSKEPIYYFQMPKGFFKDHSVLILKGMPNGHEYALLLVELMCESLPWGGYLRYSKTLPYTPEMISSVTGTNVDVVKGAIEAWVGLELAEITKDGSIYFPWVAMMTRSTTKGAEMKALQRGDGGQQADKCPPESKSLKVLESKNTNDKCDKSDKARPGAHEGLTLELMRDGFIAADDLAIDDYDAFLGGCLMEYDGSVLRTVVRYVIARCGPNVRNRFAWFREAVTDNMAMMAHEPCYSEDEVMKKMKDGFIDPKAGEVIDDL